MSSSQTIDHTWSSFLRKGGIAGAVFFTLTIPFYTSQAGELASTADSFEAGSWRVSVYGQHVKSEPVVESAGGSGIEIPLAGGGSTTIFSSANTEIEMEAEYNAVVAAMTVRPRNGLHYRFKIGQVRDYELTFASQTVDNQFRAETDGIVWGVGARANLTQGTIVSFAFALDFSYSQLIVDFDRFQSGATVSAADHRLEQDEFQTALNISKRFQAFEPYGGVKIGRTITKLKDRATKERSRGGKDFVSPFVGLSWEMFSNEYLIVEGSFVDEKSVSAGLNVQF